MIADHVSIPQHVERAHALGQFQDPNSPENLHAATIEAHAALNRAKNARTLAYGRYLANKGTHAAWREQVANCDRAKDLLLIMQKAEIDALRRFAEKVTT